MRTKISPGNTNHQINTRKVLRKFPVMIQNCNSKRRVRCRASALFSSTSVITICLGQSFILSCEIITLNLLKLECVESANVFKFIHIKCHVDQFDFFNCYYCQLSPSITMKFTSILTFFPTSAGACDCNDLVISIDITFSVAFSFQRPCL